MQTKIISGLAWKLLERFGVQGVQFVMQIILARLLDPEHYGILSLMIIFTSLANIFIQNGFNTALIQNKDVTEEDYSSVMWVTLGVAAILYAVLFFCAPVIADFYGMPDIITPFRVLAIMLIPGALNSVQLAKISREMDFKKVFYSNVAAIVISGGVGIVLAYAGAGLWALVAQTLLNVLVACIVMWFTVKWRPKLICNIKRIKVLFSFGWKLLVSVLMDALYQDLRSLVIGKKYNSETLGYYNRGKQFPQFVINAVNGAVQSVMLPAMSEKQDNKAQVKELMRNSISMSAYIIFPIMAGLVAIAEPLVQLLLTDKWLPCVPYMQIYCFTFAFYPVHSCNLQAINAMGRSDLFLKLEIIKKAYGIVVLAIAVVCFDSPIAIALSGALTTGLGWFVNAYPNKKLVNYSYIEQVVDIIPSFLMAILMCCSVLMINTFDLSAILTVVVQILVGIVIYVLLSVLFKPQPYKLIMNTLKKMIKNNP